MISVNNLLDMNGSGTVGNTVTTAIVNSGVQGPAVSVTLNPSTPTGLTVQAHGADAHDSFSMIGSGTLNSIGYTTRTLRLDNANAFTYVAIPVPQYSTACTVTGWVTLGQADAGGAGTLFDVISILTVDGRFAVFQLNNGNGGGGTGYAVNVESDTSGTTHSSYTTVTPGTRYWVSLNANFAAGTCRLDLYNTSDVLVTSITSTVNTGGNTLVATIRLGNAEVGTSTGFTTFEQIGWNYMVPPAVITPTGMADWEVKTGSNSGAGSSTTITVALTNVKAGDLILGGVSWESTDTTVTCSDGTTSLTGASFNTIDNAGASGEPHAAMFYLVASVATGSLTYTFTLGAGKTFRCAAVIALTPPTTYTFAQNGTPASANATSGTAVATGNTTVASAGLGAAYFATYGQIYTRPLVNSGFTWFADANKSLLAVNFQAAGFTGQGVATGLASNRWTCGLVGFTATAPSSSAAVPVYMNQFRQRRA